MNVQNTRILSPVIQNDFTQTPAAKAVKIKDKIGKNSKTKEKQQMRVDKKNNKNRISRTKNKTICKKSTSREEGKRTGQQKEEGWKNKKEEQVKKKMVKLKGKKKVEDDDEDFVVEEQYDDEDDNKNFDKDATDRELFEMCQGRFGLVDVIEENKETENESKIEKRKLKELIYETIEAKFKSVLKEKRELEDMLKENIEIHELFYEDEKFELFVKKFKKEFTTGLNRDENKAGTSGARHGNDNDDVDYDGHYNDEDDVGHANHGDVHVNGNDEVDFVEENEANEMGVDAEKSVKEAA
nr:hypothetical protein [Tanacetum cinerariifolium]